MATGREKGTGNNVFNFDDQQGDDRYGELFKCNICLEPYKSPRVLPCLHSFCECCLDNHIKVNVKVIIARYSVFTCPTCREEVSLPETGVTGFRRDFRVEQLHDFINQPEVSRTLPVQEVRSPSDCQFCQLSGGDGGSLQYCVDCNKRICGSCADRHKRKQIFSKHVICSGKQRRSRGSDLDEVCSQHPGEMLGYICQDCDVPICSVCAMTSHDDHVTKDVKLGLQEAIDNLKFQFKTMGARLSQLRGKLDEVNALDKVIHDTLVSQTSAVKKRVKVVMEEVHREGETLTEEITEKCQGQLEVIDRRQTDIELSVARMNSLSDLALNLIGRPAGVTLLRSYSDLTSRIGQALEDSLLLNSSIPDVRVKFDPLKLNLKLGKITTLPQQLNKPNAAIGTPPPIRTPVLAFSTEEPQHPSGLELKARFGRLGNGGGEFDSPRDVCFLGNTRFVIADTNNDRLQIFDLGGLLIKVIAQGQMKPWGVTSTREGHIAVTDNYEKCIKIFSVDGSLVDKIGKLLCPCGITCNPRGEFIVTDFFNTNAFVLDRKGAPLKRFEIRNRKQDRHTCGASRVIVGAEPEHLIAISDISNCCVKLFNKNGCILSRVIHPDHMISPQGIGVDHHGNILVADTIKQRIVVVGRDGEYVTSLETSGDRMRDVTGLAVSPSGDVIATLMKSNQIRIFNIVY